MVNGVDGDLGDRVINKQEKKKGVDNAIIQKQRMEDQNV